MRFNFPREKDSAPPPGASSTHSFQLTAIPGPMQRLSRRICQDRLRDAITRGSSASMQADLRDGLQVNRTFTIIALVPLRGLLV